MSQRRLWRGMAVLAALAALALASTVGAQSDEGVKQVERVIKASGNTVKAIGDTKLPLKKTLIFLIELIAQCLVLWFRAPELGSDTTR